MNYSWEILAHLVNFHSPLAKQGPESFNKATPTLYCRHSAGMSEDTEIFFPDTLPFPFSVRALLIRPGEHVESGQKVLKYSFVYQPAEPQSKPETRFGSWDSTFSGELSGWSVKVGDTITRERAKRRAALHLLEPCKHGMQFNGLCALCGIDMDTCVTFALVEGNQPKSVL